MTQPYRDAEHAINANASPEPNTGCWLWIGHYNRQGYGIVSVRNKQRLAHIVAYEAFIGPVPLGKHLHHRCYTESCVNPFHLDPVTPREHRVLHGEETVKTHCKYGHSKHDAYIYKSSDTNTRRQCRTCVNIRNNRRKRTYVGPNNT